MTDESPLDDMAEDESADSRRDARIAALPAVYRRNDERMALELVLLKPDADPITVFERYGYARDEALALLASPAFVKLVAAARKDVDENGVGFKHKARLQADELLAESFQIATDPLASAAVRADLIKWTAKMAGYEPKEGKDGGGGSGGMTINITFAGQQQPVQVVNGREPITIEAE